MNTQKGVCTPLDPLLCWVNICIAPPCRQIHIHRVFFMPSGLGVRGWGYILCIMQRVVLYSFVQTKAKYKYMVNVWDGAYHYNGKTFSAHAR